MEMQSSHDMCSLSWLHACLCPCRLPEKALYGRRADVLAALTPAAVKEQVQRCGGGRTGLDRIFDHPLRQDVF